jgi:ABC-type multidrug transport system fused ATPase/permease subunit
MATPGEQPKEVDLLAIDHTENVNVEKLKDNVKNLEDKVETFSWIVRRKYCSLQSYRFGDAIGHYKEKEKFLTMMILLAASTTSSFALGTVNASAGYIKVVSVGISLLTTIISGVQKIKNYPDMVDKGMKLASDWRKISNEINLRLNQDEVDDTQITEDVALNTIGDLKVQNISFTFPKTSKIKEADIRIKNAMRLLDRCVALKVSGNCTERNVELMNKEIQILLDPDSATDMEQATEMSSVATRK